MPQPVVYAQTSTTSAEPNTLPDPSELENTLVTPVPENTLDEIVPFLPETLQGLSQTIDPSQKSASIRKAPSIRKMARDSFGSNEKVTVKIDNGRDEPVSIQLENSNGDKTHIDYATAIEGDTKALTFIPPTNLRPGKYTLTITDAHGQTSEQDFYWGVLAINPDKAIYLPNENVSLAMAVLDDMGRMVCDADVTLVVTDPENKRTVLTTQDGLIKVNPECYSKGVTIVPDYEATLTVATVGKYQMELTAITHNGPRTINDSFEVRSSVDFDIQRKAPTRIYPLQAYPVEITVKANKDFKGVITEIVPDEFEITQNFAPEYIPYSKVVTNSEDAVTNDNVLGAFVSLGLPFQGDMELTQEFGGRHPDPLIQTKYEAYGVVGHDGIDFAMPVGTPIVAVDSGEIVYASTGGDYGTTVVIQHKWGKTYYGHLSEIKLSTNDKVRRGDVIALSGNTGLSTGPHLHFGLKLDVNSPTNGYYGKTDPMPFLGLAPRFGSVLGLTTVAEHQVKTIAWEVDIKAGDTIKLSYNFDAPDISPQFYTTGPLRFRDADTNLIFKEGRRWQIASDDTTTAEVDPDGDVTTNFLCTAGSDGNCTTGHYTVIDDGSSSPSTSGYIYIDSTAANVTSEFTMGDFSPSGGFLEATNVQVYIYAQSTTNANGGTLDNVEINLRVGGSLQTADVVTPAYNSWGWFSGSFDGSWTEAQVDGMQAHLTRTVQGSGNPTAQRDTVQIATVYAVVTYSFASYELLTLDGYTFENDDEDQAAGDAVDGNSVLAGSSFSSGKNLTSVKKGERVTLRMQVRNTGGSLSSNTNLGLFYDRNDGLFTKVEASTSAVTSSTPGNCTNTDWYCAGLPGSSSIASAIDPSGNLWYLYQNGSFNMFIAKYIGTGGDCGNGAFKCSAVDDATNNLGSTRVSIDFDKAGNPWIAYSDIGADALKVAHFVGGGTGSGCGTGSTDWICETVEDTANVLAQEIADIVINPSSGNAWVVYDDFTNSSVKLARYVGGGTGSGCTDSDWTCTTVQNTADSFGSEMALTFTSTASARIAFRNDTKGAVELAEYVGSSGTCSNTEWACNTILDVADTVGSAMSIGLTISGNPAIAFYNTATDGLMVAEYVGSGGDCTWSAYKCTTIVGMANLDEAASSIVTAPDGSIWIGYRDMDDTSVNLARYVGGSNGTGCDDTNWTCTIVDNTGTYASDIDLAFDTSGNALLTYREALSSAGTKYARLVRGGEIVPTAGLAGSNGDSLSASHADMTSATDSSGKSDADCITATTWNNGVWVESEEASGVSVPDGTSTSQCTEIAFTIDTSKAVEGRTYRFTLATDNTFGPENTFWRGLEGFTSSTLPTITIESSNTRRYSKDANPIFANCTDTTWGCETVDATSTLGTFWNGMTIDSSGRPWINYYNDHASADELKVATYVGSGGNCDLTGGSDAWQCTVVDASAAIIGANGSITTDKSGNIWVSYRDSTNGDLKIATNHDHPSMSACTASGWDCEIVDGTATSVGNETTIAIDPGGNPWISYRDATNADLRYARYVGVGGNCTSTEWDCGDIDSGGGEDTTIIFDDNGKAYVSYFSPVGVDLKVAEYVGTGGNCTGGGSWNCSVVDASSANLGNYTSMAIDKNGYPWIVYHDTSGAAVRVATKQNDPNMSACTDTAWDCGIIDNTVTAGADPSIAFDEKNMALVGYYTSTTIKTARYVGTGGSCSGSGNIWNCTTLDSSAADVGEYSHNGLKFDHSGVPWVVYQDVTNTNIKVAKLHMPDYISDFRYMLSSGKAPATAADGTCDSTTDNKGYCGVYAQDSNYDQITTLANERPMFMFAERFSSNSTAPTGTWQGRTNIAPTTDTLTLQVYRFGSTNAWENLDTDSASSDCSSADCELTGTAGGTASEYYQADGSNYWVYYRVFQTENASAITLKTGCFDGGNGDCTGGGGPETPTLDKLMRGGKWFNSSGVIQPFTF